MAGRPINYDKRIESIREKQEKLNTKIAEHRTNMTTEVKKLEKAIADVKESYQIKINDEQAKIDDHEKEINRLSGQQLIEFAKMYGKSTTEILNEYLEYQKSTGNLSANYQEAE